MLRLSAKLLLLFALISGQWAYAEHNADAMGSSHSHAIDCATCLTQANDLGAMPLFELPFKYHQSASPIPHTPLFMGAVTSLHQSIRAPPVK